MNTIIIEGAEKALEAGGWARENIKNTWDISIEGNPFSTHYAFIFSDAKDATHFALRWR